jgi:hypothetical protein
MNTRRLAACLVLPLTVAACGLSAGGPPAAPAASPDSTVSPTPSAAPSALAELCVGPESTAIDLPQVVRRYLGAWNEHDAEARVRILDDIWADEATYLEPAGLADGPVLGREEMSDLIGQNQGPEGTWFEPRAWHEGYAHHDVLVMPWRQCTPDGPTGVIGTDYAELDAQDRMTLAVGFSPLTPDGSGVGERPTAVCAGPEGVDWSAMPPIVERYTAAWNSAASAERESILNAIADEETQMAGSWDPSTPVGPAEITEFIDQWTTPGNYFELSTWGDGDHHDSWFHVRWRECASTREGLVEGIEILHVDSDGKLERAASFAGW